jgi:hypothetical protein
MLDQYRLKLKDGTILAVDFDGLKPWLLEEKVMVQPPGSRKWRPLKQVLAQGRPEALIPRPVAVPISVPAASAPTPPPAPAAPPAPAIEARAPIDERPIPVAAPPPGMPVMPEEEYAEPDIPLTAEATAPLAEPVTSRKAKVDDGIATIPLKPLDDEPPIHSTVAPPAPPMPPRRRDPAPKPAPVNLLDVAAAEVERHSPAERPWQWTARDARAAAATPATAPAAMLPVAAASSAPAVIRLAPPDPEPEPPRVYDDEVLPELEMVEDKAAIAQEKVAAMVREVSQQADRLIHDIAHSPATATAQATITKVARRWSQWSLPVAGVLALLLAAAVTRSLWMPLFSGSGSRRPALATPPTLPPAPEIPPPPPEVQTAMDRLPHMSPDTIQLVMSTSPFGSATPPEAFRFGHTAAERGSSALTAEEAGELRELRNSVLGALRSVDRRRVQAYGRMTAGRDLLVAEDERVMALFARGVRALPPPRQERLQALLGKAIAAGLKDRPRATPLPR